jgi:hypothetical protein
MENTSSLTGYTGTNPLSFNRFLVSNSDGQINYNLGGYYPGTNYTETLTFGFISNSANVGITLSSGNNILAVFSISPGVLLTYISLSYYQSNTVTATLNIFDITNSVTAPNVGTTSVLSGAPITINSGAINNIWSSYRNQIVITPSNTERIIQIVINASVGSRFNICSILCGLSPLV